MDWGMHLEEDNEEDMRKQWLREDENGTIGITTRTKQPEIKVFFKKVRECTSPEQHPAGGDGECVQADCGDHHPVLVGVAGVQGGPRWILYEDI